MIAMTQLRNLIPIAYVALQLLTLPAAIAQTRTVAAAQLRQPALTHQLTHLVLTDQQRHVVECIGRARQYSKNVHDLTLIERFLKQELRCDYRETEEFNSEPHGTFLGVGDALDIVPLRVSSGPVESCTESATNLLHQNADADNAYRKLIILKKCSSRNVAESSDSIAQDRRIRWGLDSAEIYFVVSSGPGKPDCNEIAADLLRRHADANSAHQRLVEQLRCPSHKVSEPSGSVAKGRRIRWELSVAGYSS